MIKPLLLRAGLAAGLALALSGCLGLGGAKAPPTLLTLSPATTLAAGGSATGSAADGILVMDPETDRAIGVNRVAVRIDDTNIAYLKQAQWVERPARLFGSLLAETIRAGGRRLVFTGDDALASGETRLGGRLVDFGYDARTQSAVVRFDAVRTGKAGSIATKRFEAVVPGVSASPESVGPALNKAANAVAAEVAAWVG